MGAGATTVKHLIRERATEPGSHVTPSLFHPAAPATAIPEPRSQRGRERRQRSHHPQLTDLSHPGDAEAGEAEEHEGGQRDQHVHVLGPHEAGLRGAAAAPGVERSSGAPPAPPPSGIGARAAAPAPLDACPAPPAGRRVREDPSTPALWLSAKHPEPLARAAGS